MALGDLSAIPYEVEAPHIVPRIESWASLQGSSLRDAAQAHAVEAPRIVPRDDSQGSQPGCSLRDAAQESQCTQPGCFLLDAKQAHGVQAAALVSPRLNAMRAKSIQAPAATPSRPEGHASGNLPQAPPVLHWEAAPCQPAAAPGSAAACAAQLQELQRQARQEEQKFHARLEEMRRNHEEQRLQMRQQRASMLLPAAAALPSVEEPHVQHAPWWLQGDKSTAGAQQQQLHDSNSAIGQPPQFPGCNSAAAESHQQRLHANTCERGMSQQLHDNLAAGQVQQQLATTPRQLQGCNSAIGQTSQHLLTTPQRLSGSDSTAGQSPYMQLPAGLRATGSAGPSQQFFDSNSAASHLQQQLPMTPQQLYVSNSSASHIPQQMVGSSSATALQQLHGNNARAALSQQNHSSNVERGNQQQLLHGSNSTGSMSPLPHGTNSAGLTPHPQLLQMQQFHRSSSLTAPSGIGDSVLPREHRCSLGHPTHQSNLTASQRQLMHQPQPPACNGGGFDQPVSLDDPTLRVPNGLRPPPGIVPGPPLDAASAAQFFAPPETLNLDDAFMLSTSGREPLQGPNRAPGSNRVPEAPALHGPDLDLSMQESSHLCGPRQEMQDSLICSGMSALAAWTSATTCGQSSELAASLAPLSIQQLASQSVPAADHLDDLKQLLEYVIPDIGPDIQNQQYSVQHCSASALPSLVQAPSPAVLQNEMPVQPPTQQSGTAEPQHSFSAALLPQAQLSKPPMSQAPLTNQPEGAVVGSRPCQNLSASLSSLVQTPRPLMKRDENVPQTEVQCTVTAMQQPSVAVVQLPGAKCGLEELLRQAEASAEESPKKSASVSRVAEAEQLEEPFQVETACMPSPSRATCALVQAARAHAQNRRMERQLKNLRSFAQRQRREANSTWSVPEVSTGTSEKPVEEKTPLGGTIGGA